MHKHKKKDLERDNRSVFHAYAAGENQPLVFSALAEYFAVARYKAIKRIGCG